MDPISQASLGAIAARAVAPSATPGRILLMGAAAGALPDLDVLFTLVGDAYDQLVWHRGITHSLFFAPVVGPLLGWWLWRRERQRDASATQGDLWAWVAAMVAALLSHPILDAFTSYGTQLLAPFSDQRFAWFAMPILDPLYTGLLLLGVLWAARSKAPQRTGLVALTVTSMYLGASLWAGAYARQLAAEDLTQRGVRFERIEAFPTLLQIFGRRVVARAHDADYAGELSLWRPCAIDWQSARSASEHRATWLATREGRIFDWFSMGWAHYSADDSGALYMFDLRYGGSSELRQSFFNLTMPQPGAAPIATLGTDTEQQASRLSHLANLVFPKDCVVRVSQLSGPS